MCGPFGGLCPLSDNGFFIIKFLVAFSGGWDFFALNPAKARVSPLINRKAGSLMCSTHFDSYENFTLEQLIDDGIAFDGVDDAIYDLETALRAVITLAELRQICAKEHISMENLDEKLAGRVCCLANRSASPWPGPHQAGLY